MKKALSLILSLLMLVSALVMPVAADADNGFNDGEFGSWDSVGSKTNPNPVATPASFPEEVELAANSSVYYQFPALKFAGWSLSVTGVTAVDFNDTMVTEADMIARAIKVTLTVEGDLVGFINDTDEAVTVGLLLEQPLGSINDPAVVEDGDNAVSIPTAYPQYFAQYLPMSSGDYTLSASDYENFLVYIDIDSDPTTDADWVALTETTVFTCESYMPIFFVVCPIGPTPDIVLTVIPPVKGTEENPYWLSDYSELLNGVSGLGDAMWPATTEGVYYNLGFDGATLLVTGEGTVSVTVNGKSWASMTGSLEIPLSLGEDEYVFKTIICAASDVKLDVRFPLGTENNPHVLSGGANTIYLPDSGETIHATYTAEKDGVLLINPHTIAGLGYTDAVNNTTGDYDFIFAGVEGEGASEDFVITLPVTAGDVIKITTCAGENEDFEILAMNLKLHVCYEGDHKLAAATCTKASTCSACGLSVGSKKGHSYKTVTVKATTTANGYSVKRCSVCSAETDKKTYYKVSSITLSKTSYTYNGKVQKPTVTVKNSAGTKLTEGTSYTVKYSAESKTAGTYKVTITLKGNYSGTKTLSYTIKAQDVSKCTVTLSKTSYSYDGAVKKPTVTVKNAAGTKLTEGSSYTVTYASGRKVAGTYKVTIKMKGNYTGTVTKTFKIAPQDVSKCKISLSATSYTYNGAVKKPTVTVKNAAGTKLSTASYTVTYASGRKNVGTYKVTIKMKGNYTGTKTLTFKINPVKTSISSVTAGSKKLTVKWAKKTTQVTGYQIQYSTSKSFSSVKTKTISKNSTISAALTGLKAKTTYYIRVRTYKTVNGVKYYSGWTTVKSAKTK